MQIITRAVGDGALDVEDPLIERLYLSRGLTRSEETDKGLKSLVSPLGLMDIDKACLLYTSPSPRDGLLSRMPSSA